MKLFTRPVFSLLVVSSMLLLNSCGGNDKSEESQSENPKTEDSTLHDGGAQNANLGAMRIAWVDRDTVNKYYELAIKLRETITTETDSISKIAQKLEAKYLKKEQQIAKDQHLYGQTELQQKAQQLQQAALETQQKIAQMEQALQQKQYFAQTRFIEKTNEYMMVIGQDLGYDYVISHAPGEVLLFANPAHDITKTVIEKLNAAYNASEAF